MKRAVDIFLNNILDQGVEENKNKHQYPIEQENIIIDSILLDLHYLLNSKMRVPDFDNISSSIMSYGIPDLTKYVAYSKEDQKTVMNIIKNSLNNFEKRLSDIEVTLKNENDINYNYNFEFSFEIKAKIEIGLQTIELAIISNIQQEVNQVVVVSNS